MNRRRPASLVTLERIGPTDPIVREYVTDVGVLTVNFAQLERHIRATIETVLTVAKAGVIELPVKFRQVHDRPGKRTLGRLIEELKALGVEEKLAQALGQANADRISIIHQAITLADEEQGSVNYPAIKRERRRLRQVLRRVRSVYTGIQEAEVEVFELFLQTGRARHGDHPQLRAVAQKLQNLQEQLEQRRKSNPSP